MNTLVRKLRSLLVHLGTPGNLGPACRRNAALLRARVGGRGCFTYTSPVGVPFVCFPENATSLRLYVKGYQELVEIEVARAWLQSDESCIDVGANIGLLSAAFASAVGPCGNVLSLEPSPVAFSYLAAMLRVLALDNVTPIACCASETTGLTPFFIAASGATDAEEESMRVAPQRSGEFRQSLVPSAPLTSLCGEIQAFSRPSLIKIDVEGAEPLVLRGGAELLTASTPPLVICEIHQTALGNYEFTPADLLAHFPVDRFDLYFIPRSVSDQTSGRRHGCVYRLDDPAQLPIYSNLVALPRDGYDEPRIAAARRVLLAHSAA